MWLNTMAANFSLSPPSWLLSTYWITWESGDISTETKLSSALTSCREESVLTRVHQLKQPFYIELRPHLNAKQLHVFISLLVAELLYCPSYLLLYLILTGEEWNTMTTAVNKRWAAVKSDTHTHRVEKRRSSLTLLFTADATFFQTCFKISWPIYCCRFYRLKRCRWPQTTARREKMKCSLRTWIHVTAMSSLYALDPTGGNCRR